MKNHSLLFLLFFITIANSFAQNTFQKRYGGHKDEKITGLTGTFDGDYVMAGGTASFGDTTFDIYLIKTDSSGSLIWSMVYGGAFTDYCNKVIETADHGLLLIGFTYSFGSGSEDAFLMKTDSAGNVKWSKAYGGLQDDFFFNARQTNDGGYIAVGATTSLGAGGSDMLIIRTDASGDTLWTRILGGASFDQALDIIQTADSDFVISGRTQSFGPVFQDGFLGKLSQAGDTLWTRIFGCNNQQEATSLKQTYDGGYVVTGSSIGASTSYDAYFNRFDSTGHLIWSKLYSGHLPDAMYNIALMSDSGFALLGFTNSFGAPHEFQLRSSAPPPPRPQGDDSSNVYIIRTDANGDTLWTREYGGYIQDESYGLIKTANDGLVIAGYSSSFGPDNNDAYLIKTDAAGHSGCWEKSTNPVVSSPNTIVGNTNIQIFSGISVTDAPFASSVPATFAEVICSPTGVDNKDVSLESLILYPNPATNLLNINIPSFHHNEPVNVIIANMLGQMLVQSETTHPKSEINISSLSPGIYFVQVDTKKQRWTERFVKE